MQKKNQSLQQERQKRKEQKQQQQVQLEKHAKKVYILPVMLGVWAYYTYNTQDKTHVARQRIYAIRI